MLMLLTMNELIILFLTCIYFLKMPRAMCSDLVVNQKLEEYLTNELNSVHAALSWKNNSIDTRDTNTVEIKNLETIPYPQGNHKRATSFTFFYKTFILIDNKLHYLEQFNNTFTINYFTSFDKAESTEIIFAKAIQYNRLGILLVATKSEMRIYGFNKTNNYIIHTISTPYAVDAHFFTNRGKLYLIVANNKGDNLALTTIYKWLGTHFDEIETVYTTGAIKVTSFSSISYEIIIILQHLPNKEVLSSVYEFNVGKIKKIQHIKCPEPIYIASYAVNNKKHVVIFEKNKNNSIYAWKEKGSQLVRISQFETQYPIKKSAVFHTPQSAVLILPLKDRLQIFHATTDGLKLEKEKYYSSNYLAILDIYTVPINEGGAIFVAALDENNVLKITSTVFKVQFNETDHQPEKSDVLCNCFNRLEGKLYNQRKTLREFNENFNQSRVDVNANLTKAIQTPILSQIKEVEPDTESSLEIITTRIEAIRPLFNKYQNTKENDITINGRAVIQGNVEAEKVSGKDINIKNINDDKWAPDQWLRYNESQTIRGPVKVSTIITNDLATASEDTLFKDLLLKNANQEISGDVTVENLTANNMFAKKINGVLLDDIYSKKNPQPIKGLKTFRNLSVTEANVKLLNGKAPENVLSLFTNNSTSPRLVFDSHVEVENLTVEWIGDLHWETFKNSVFRMGISTEINGTLTFPTIKTEKLTLKTLNGVKIEDLLTTSTDQIVEADIQFNRIFAENITSNSTNNIKLANVVQLGDDRLVEGPVKFDKLYVRKDLQLTGKIDKSLFLRNGDHIIGTNETDFLQRYNGKITIKGNLYLNNITLQPEAKVFVSEEELNPNVSDIYWTKSTNQKIPIRFQAQRGLKAPHLLTEMINNIKVSQYMLNNDEDKFETSFHFTNVSIAGNVILNRAAKHTPDLHKINKSAVKTNGSFIITGKKKYTNTLRIENLATNVLEGIIVFDTVTTKSSEVITGKKIFKNLIIKGNLMSNLQSLESINGVHLKQLLEKVVYIDRPQNLTKLHFKNITVSDLYATRLNDHHVNEYILNLEKLNATEKFDELRVEGNVQLKNIKNVSTVNGVNFEELLDNALEIGDYGARMVDLRFLGHLKVDNLVTAHINEVDLRDLTERFLQRNGRQTVTAPYSFTRITAKNIVTKKINNVSVKDLVDVSSDEPQTIYAPDGIEFSSVKLLKSLDVQNETFPCDIGAALNGITDPPTQDWHKMEVKGNATFMDADSILHRVFEKAVTINSTNIVQAPVNFSSHILAENVVSKKHINDINIQEIIDDAVVTDSEEEQVITGQKTFPTLQVVTANVMKNMDTPVINDMVIPEINKTLVRKNEVSQVVIRGKKTFFGGLQTERFYSKKVSNTDMDNIVNLQNTRKIPSALFDSLEVENNLNITYINHIPFQDVLQKRLLTKGLDEQIITGVYYFENIDVESMTTPSINKIRVDDIVFDLNQQNISSPKRFLQKVEIYGNVTADYINGVDMQKTQEMSIVPGEDTNIDGSVTILRPSIINGGIYADYLNGYPVAKIKEILHKTAERAAAQKIHSMRNDIVDVIKKHLPYVQAMPDDFMYLEKSDALQILVPDSLTAKTITSKDYVLLHVIGEEFGESCGLPHSCRCPMQYSMEISPEHSVDILPNKHLQRTFSYDDGSMIVHFITNSVSTDSTCRTSTPKVLNEVSMMSWSTMSTGNNTGAFYQYKKFIQGYISGVEFFTINGKSYAVIARYYDPVLDTHDLDCIVIKFSENKSNAEEIQRILIKGAWSIYSFHTAQGVTLIVGTIENRHSHIEEQTLIYRFTEDIQQFDLLRIIPSYGCLMATGVVLGADSLIVLAHRSAFLRVFKYDHHFDNYYFYQSFNLDVPVHGISVFYTRGFGISDAYLCIVTENENYFIYSFKFIEGWKLESSGEIEGLRNLIPFELNKQLYLFAPSTKISSLLTVVKHGSV